MAFDPKAHWRRLCGATLALVVAAFLAPRWAAAPDLAENRPLAAPPDRPRSWAEWRALPKALDVYVADRFPARPHLIGALNFLRMKIGASGSANVVVGRDGWLFYDNGSHFGAARNDPIYTDDQAREWLAALAGRSEAAQRRGAVYLVAVPPDKETLYPQHGPAWYAGPNLNRSAVLLSRLAARSGAGEVVYLHEALARPTQWGLKTYSAHDTHWTGLGAYYGYAAIMRRLQALGRTEGPRPIEAFAEVRQRDPDKPRNLALMLGAASFVEIDYPELADPGSEDPLRTTWLGAAQDWTSPRVIDTGQAGKPVLLMTMDSFSNALTPFFYAHFSRIVLAHNQDGSWREDLIDRFQPDVVLLEVVESGLPVSLSPAPAASEEAKARIAAALAAPHRVPEAQAVVTPARVGRIRRIGGGPGPDRLEGSARDDFILGRAGDDTLSGGRGHDRIRGGRGRDRILGGDGEDWLSGDRDADTLIGGRGADVFRGEAGGGVDRILDFSAAEGDRVVIDPGIGYAVRQHGHDTVIELPGSRLVLVGVSAASLPKGAISRR